MDTIDIAAGPMESEPDVVAIEIGPIMAEDMVEDLEVSSDRGRARGRDAVTEAGAVAGGN